MQPGSGNTQSEASLVALGSDNQFGDVAIGTVAAGDIITTTTVVQPAPPVSLERTAEVLRPPLPPRSFRNREAALATIRAELRPRHGVWVTGPPGNGRTALLRTAANLAETGAFAHGVAFVGGASLPLSYRPDGTILPLSLDDCAQHLIDLFYRSSDEGRPVRLSLAQARKYLDDLNAVIVLDDLPLVPADLAQLPDLLTHSAVLIAADGPGPDTLATLSLGALPRSHAAALLAAWVGEPSPRSETLDQLCAALDDLPLPLHLAGALLRAQILSAAELAAALETAREGEPVDALTRIVGVAISHLDAVERAVITALAACPGPNAALEAVVTVSQQPYDAVVTALEHLGAAGLIQGNAERYAFASTRVRRAVVRLLQPEAARERATAYFVAAAAHRPDLAWARSELGNLIGAAHDRAASGQDAELATLIRAIVPVAVHDGYWSIWRQAANWAEQLAERAGHAALGARATYEQGLHAGLSGDATTARTALDEARQRFRRLHDTNSVARTSEAIQTLGLARPPRRRLLAALVGIALLVPGLVWWHGSAIPTPPVGPAPTAQSAPGLPSTSPPSPSLAATDAITPLSQPQPAATGAPTPTPTSTALPPPPPPPLPTLSTPRPQPGDPAPATPTPAADDDD